MAWTLFSEHTLVTGRSTITHWPRYPITIKPLRFGETLDEAYYLEFQRKLRNLRMDAVKLRTLKEDGMDVSSRLIDGPQFVYCPSKLSCVKGQKYG